MACPSGTLRGCDFTQILVHHTPNWDKEIIQSIRPNDGGWIGHVASGVFPANMGTELTQDRFEHVFPNTSHPWTAKHASNCFGTPCDKTEHYIGWGSSRRTWGLYEQSWATPLLCFDQLMHVTHAKEQSRQITSDILKPATLAIQSNYIRRRVVALADRKLTVTGTPGGIATLAATLFTAAYDANGDEVFMLSSQMPTGKLLPPMLQNQFTYLVSRGYFDKNPFGDKKGPPLIELVTGLETCHELDRMGGQTGLGGTQPSLTANYRWQQWDAANEYWRYGMSGQIGNFATRVDPFELRFNYVGASGDATYPFRFQYVPPYTNVVSSGAGGAAGLRSEDNPDYALAQYSFSIIHHRNAMEFQVFNPEAINPEMPFAVRGMGGEWQFVRDNLGADVNGIPIENRRHNKGQFIADFLQAMRPRYTELEVVFFHKREPMCMYVVDTCNPDPGSPAQDYNSANDACPEQ